MSLVAKFKDLQSLSSGYKYIPFKNALQPYLVLFLISFFVFINSINNEVAYDDEIVLHRNEFVMKGIKGIPSIISHDSYYSYYKQLGMENSLPAGRYRPLSFITFAIEQEFIGTIPDGIVRPNSWDVNNNGVKDQFEDTNKDGIYTDYDFWVKGSGLRHFNNIFLYALAVVIVYHVLSTFIFSKNKDLIFCSLFLFALHPLHTEVVANIKSRDEILSLIFIFLTLYFSFQYLFQGTKKQFFYILISMFAALLSKEYALFLFVFIPATIYVFYKDIDLLKNKYFWFIISMVVISSFALIKFFNSGTLIATPILFTYLGFLLSKKSNLKSVRLMYALGISLIFYLAIRFSASQHQIEIEAFKNDIISNPYMFATSEQIWASKIATWMRYLKLFFVPNPLLVDYSYKSIPYSDFSSPLVWVSIIVFSFLIVAAILTFIFKKLWSFGLLLLLGFFFPVSNLIIDIGATMGERLFFHSSLGVCILFMMSLFYFIEKWSQKNKKIISVGLLLVIIQGSLFATLTIRRNPDWKNNITLFTHDVKFVPENINLISGAASSYYELAFLPINKNERDTLIKQSIEFARRGVKVYSNHDQLYFTIARNYFALNELDSSRKYISIVDTITPNFPFLPKLKEKISTRLMVIGVKKFENKDTLDAIRLLYDAYSTDSTNTSVLNNLGKVYFELKNYEKSSLFYNKTIKFDPKNNIAISALSLINLKLSNKKTDLKDLISQLNRDKKNPTKWYLLGITLFDSGSYDKALACFQMSLQLDPANTNAKEMIVKIKKMNY